MIGQGAEELVSGADIGRRLGVSRQRVYQWVREHPDFPRPVGHFGRIHIWRWADIEDWAERRKAVQASAM